MAFWDLCELNQLAERFECQHEARSRAGRSWGGGKKVRPRLLAAATVRCYQLHVKRSQSLHFISGLFLLHHGDSQCRHRVCDLDQHIDVAEN